VLDIATKVIEHFIADTQSAAKARMERGEGEGLAVKDGKVEFPAHFRRRTFRHDATPVRDILGHQAIGNCQLWAHSNIAGMKETIRQSQADGDWQVISGSVKKVRDERRKMDMFLIDITWIDIANRPDNMHENGKVIPPGVARALNATANARPGGDG
jgi:hypothetical protein